MQFFVKNSLDEKIKCGAQFSETFLQMREAKDVKVISFVNPFSYFKLLNLSSLTREIDVFFSDGSLLCLFHGFFCKQKVKRASFDYSSIAGEVLDYSVREHLKIAIVGATQEELEGAIVHLKAQHEGLDVVYSRNGYFLNSEDMLSSIDALSTSQADLLLIGMGTPYQEEYAALLKRHCKKTLVALTCGGFLTQTSMRPDYYYPIVKKLGVRWLQRMVMHRHVRERVIKDYPKFVFHYIKDKLFRERT